MKRIFIFLILCVTRLPAQKAPSNGGFVLQLHLAQASGWKLVQSYPDGTQAREAAIRSTAGLGLRVVFPGLRSIRPMLEYNSALFGSNDYSVVRGGVEWNGRGGHSAPAMTLSVGRVKETGGVSFTQIAAGAGVTFRISRLVGVRGEMEYAFAVNPDQNRDVGSVHTSHIRIEGDIARFLIGFRLGKF